MLKDILRTIKWYSKFAIMLVITSPALKIAKNLKDKGKLKEFNEFCTVQTAKWCQNRIKDSGAKINIDGLENIPDENVLFVANHQSHFDIAVLVALIPKSKGFVAKSELGKIPILRAWMKNLGCILLDRKDMKQSVRAINDAIKSLKTGNSLVIFPEGTRSKDGKITDFKAGSFKLATKSGVPIVPITIDGTYKIKEANNNLIKPADVHIHIHKPIYIDNLSREEKDDLHNTVCNIIRDKHCEI